MNVKVFQDPWFLRPKYFKPITVSSHLLYQCDMLNEVENWDLDKVDSTLWEVDREEVMCVSVGIYT